VKLRPYGNKWTGEIKDKKKPFKLMINVHENICARVYWKKSMFLADRCQGD
jgi:hypothetical protein